MREVRLALLEADVNFKVVKDFVARVREKALGQDILQSLTAGQAVVKIVHDELVDLLGTGDRVFHLSGNPAVVAMVGLQGSGKTTTTAKLARYVIKQGGDRSSSRPTHTGPPPPTSSRRSASSSTSRSIARPRARPSRTSLVRAWRPPSARPATWSSSTPPVGSASTRPRAGDRHRGRGGQSGRDAPRRRRHDRPEAVAVAQAFAAAVPVTGLVLTKIDGDARGGAALSISAVTGLPVKFLGTGEKTDALEPFHPDRLAGRILGMGDILTLVERAQETFDVNQAQQMEELLEGELHA